MAHTGKLQRAIMDHIRTRGKWILAVDLSWSIFNRNDDEERDRKPTYAFHVSIRRAAASLVKAGLLMCGTPNEHRYGEEKCKMAYWLPGMEAPRCKPILRGEAVRSAVLRYISSANPDDWLPKRLDGHERYLSEGWIPYPQLTCDVSRMLNDRSSRTYTAIHRAVYALQETGSVKVMWYKDRHIGLVRKNVAV